MPSARRQQIPGMLHKKKAGISTSLNEIISWFDQRLSTIRVPRSLASGNSSSTGRGRCSRRVKQSPTPSEPDQANSLAKYLLTKTPFGSYCLATLRRYGSREEYARLILASAPATYASLHFAQWGCAACDPSCGVAIQFFAPPGKQGRRDGIDKCLVFYLLSVLPMLI